MNQKTNLRSFSIPYMLVCILTFIILIILLIPILRIARYNVPSADDFSFSCETHAAVVEDRSIIVIISGALNKVKDVYFSWQGTFSAIFMMAFQPSIWGFRYYGLTTYAMIVSLFGGVFFFCFRLFSGLFEIKKSLSAIIASVICIAVTQFVPMANQSFYWYNGSVYYTFTFGLMLVMYAVYLGYILHGGVCRIILLCLFSILIGGSNYVTALLSSIISLGIIAFLILRNDRKWLPLLVPFIFLLISFSISILAPGNNVRQEEVPNHPGPFQAIILSFRYGFFNMIKWFDLRFFACILFLLPFLFQSASSCQHFAFRLPLLFTVFSFCLYSSAFTPHIYALASDGPDRLKNIVYFFFVILTVINLFWWCGWISHKVSIQCTNNFSISGFIFVLFSTGALLSIACAIFVFNKPLTSVLAINELRSGEALSYYEEALERQKFLEDPYVLNCEFKPFESTPYLLFFTDMTDDPLDFQNVDTATYYSKNSIIVR